MSCLVIGIDADGLESARQVPPRSLEGVQLLLTAAGPSESMLGAIRSLAATGASVVVLVTPLVEADPNVRLNDPQDRVFVVRNVITDWRAADARVPIVIDAEAFGQAGIPLALVAPYVDAVIGATWSRLPEESSPSVERLVAASLTPASERVVLPVARIDWQAVREFAERAAELVEVTGVRRLTAEEIVARHQAQQRRQDAAIKTTIAAGTTTLLFEVPDFSAPITITAGTTIFRGPEGTSIEERDIRVNGAAIAGGSATSPPQLPLIEAERISTPPLIIALDDAYRYALDGEDEVAGARCYVISFEPRVARGALARGRAWIAAGDFTLRRMESIQRDLRGAIVSSEEVNELGRFRVGSGDVWLPVETRIFQSYVGAGFRTPVHRTIVIEQYEVNSERFDTRLAAAFASNNVMMRDTPEGLRYLVRREGSSEERSTVTSGSHTIRSMVGGVLVDPNISRPLAFAGLSYVNLDLFGRGAQLNVFFGGVFGQASWTIPSIAGTRWQAHGSAFGVAAQFSDRVFRNGREQYRENIQQQPAFASVGVLRPLTPRVRATIDYVFDVTAFERTVNTSASFQVPRTIVNHGALLAIDADRGAWSLRGWWNPARRSGWRPWGMPGTFDPGSRDYQRYGMRLTRTLALRSSVNSRVETSWMGGRDLDRFSRFGFDSFENPLHGYPTTSIRYDRGVLLRSATAWTIRGVRLDGFGDAALVRDPGWASTPRLYPGIGAGIESAGPFRTLLSLEWAYGFRAPRTDGGRGTQTARITVYKGF